MRKPEIEEKDLHGFKHFKLLMPALQRLHDDGRHGTVEDQLFAAGALVVQSPGGLRPTTVL